MTMHDLIADAGGVIVTPRFIRFLVSEGVIPPPLGGRAHATCDARQLEGVQSYLRLRALGVSAAHAKSLIRGARGETVPLQLVAGLTLHVDLASFDPDVDPALLAQRIEHALCRLMSLIEPERQPHDRTA